MNIIQITYLLALGASVVAMLPQIKQLLVSKQSDELNLTTWWVWTGYQLTALVYSISIKAIPYILVNIAWVSFYAVMLTLIIKYRRSADVVPVSIPARDSIDAPLFFEDSASLTPQK